MTMTEVQLGHALRCGGNHDRANSVCKDSRSNRSMVDQCPLHPANEAEIVGFQDVEILIEDIREVTQAFWCTIRLKRR